LQWIGAPGRTCKYRTATARSVRGGTPAADTGSNVSFYRDAHDERPSLYNRGSMRRSCFSDPMPLPRTCRAFVAALLIARAGVLPARGDPVAPVLLVVGDSISAAYGLPPGTGWVELLSARIAAERYRYSVVNASITGDTTAGGRARLPALIARHHPAIVVIELGGNDGLRGGNIDSTRDNLTAMVADVKRSGAKALIVGMRLPPNYGTKYVRDFDGLFADVAKAQRTPLVPFLFEGFAERNEMFQPDRVHPTVAAQPMLLDNVWPVLRPLLAPPR
jgi:acyl-CoA thioesterase-1